MREMAEDGLCVLAELQAKRSGVADVSGGVCVVLVALILSLAVRGGDCFTKVGARKEFMKVICKRRIFRKFIWW